MMVWLSFADPTRPDGFLGAVVMEVAVAVSDKYDDAAFREAIRLAHELDINPGGEVVGFRIEPKDEPRFKPYVGRLLDRIDMKAIGERHPR